MRRDPGEFGPTRREIWLIRLSTRLRFLAPIPQQSFRRSPCVSFDLLFVRGLQFLDLVEQTEFVIDLVRAPAAFGMAAPAVDIRCLLHRFALRAAVLVGLRGASAGWMSAFLVSHTSS